MKQDYIEKQAKNQIKQNIFDSLTGSNQKASPLPLHKRGDWALQESSNLRYCHLPQRRPVPTPSEGGKGGGFCKGPPGRSRSPGIVNHLFPEHPPDHCPANETHLKTNLKSIIASSLTVRQRAEIHLNTEYQKFNKTQFLKLFNFFIMKKQILFIAFLALAVFANVNKSYGQELTGTLTCPVPQAVVATCLSSDALHPIPGTPYTYSITVPAPALGTRSYKWIVTQEKTFITTGTLNVTNAESVGGTHVAAAGAELNAANGDAAPDGKDISITWKSFVHDPAAPVFVVIYVENLETCTTQNLKVYQIEPKNAFTLDIANLAVDGTFSAYGTALETCFSNIASATYDPAVGANGVIYDYGTNYIYYTVTAANFTTSWRPTFRLSGLDALQDVEMHWAYQSTPTVWAAMTGGGTNGDYTTTGTVDAKDATGTVGTAGECIIVRLKVDHNKFEGLALLPITLAVDGQTQLALTTPLKDVHHATGAQCGLDDNFDNDKSTHNLKPRPTITDAIPEVPNPTNYLPSK